MNYSNAGKRFVAYILDVLILGVVSFLVGMVLGGILGAEKAAGINLALQIALGVLYTVVYQAKMNGQTVGKKVMKIKVVTDSGKVPTMMTLFLREVVGKTVSGLILGIGYLMILWDGKKQGLHDKIASTYVVRA